MEMTRRTFLTATAATTAVAATNALALDKWGRDRDWTGDPTVTYPEPAWEVFDKRFSGRQGNATLQRIWHGMGNNAALWLEGSETGAALSAAISRIIACCAGRRTTAT
jgi:gluconolactonase